VSLLLLCRFRETDTISYHKRSLTFAWCHHLASHVLAPWDRQTDGPFACTLLEKRSSLHPLFIIESSVRPSEQQTCMMFSNSRSTSTPRITVILWHAHPEVEVSRRMSHHVVGRYRRPNKTPAFFFCGHWIRRFGWEIGWMYQIANLTQASQSPNVCA
jgi:hypothetical protein